MQNRLVPRIVCASAFGAGACTVSADRDPARRADDDAVNTARVAAADPGRAASAAEGTSRPANAAVAEAPPAGGARRPLQGPEVTRELEQKADEVLKANGDSPIGTELPFELDGRRYVARIEEHYRAPESAAAGPKGPHRGVTVYALD